MIPRQLGAYYLCNSAETSRTPLYDGPFPGPDLAAGAAARSDLVSDLVLCLYRDCDKGRGMYTYDYPSPATKGNHG